MNSPPIYDSKKGFSLMFVNMGLFIQLFVVISSIHTYSLLTTISANQLLKLSINESISCVIKFRVWLKEYHLKQ